MWPFTKPTPIKPIWVYQVHDRVGVNYETGTHEYVVTYQRGIERRKVPYSFHAQTLGEKPEAKMKAYFIAQAAKMNGE